MYGSCETPGVVPAENKNPEPPTPPTDHEQETPELLNKLIAELDDIRTERGRLLAESMAPVNSYGSKGYKSNVRVEWERRNRTNELDDKEGELMRQIRDLMHLLPPEQRPKTLGFM